MGVRSADGPRTRLAVPRPRSNRLSFAFRPRIRAVNENAGPQRRIRSRWKRAYLEALGLELSPSRRRRPRPRSISSPASCASSRTRRNHPCEELSMRTSITATVRCSSHRCSGIQTDRRRRAQRRAQSLLQRHGAHARRRQYDAGRARPRSGSSFRRYCGASPTSDSPCSRRRGRTSTTRTDLFDLTGRHLRQENSRKRSILSVALLVLAAVFVLVYRQVLGVKELPSWAPTR
jgi:hypothetical protein